MAYTSHFGLIAERRRVRTISSRTQYLPGPSTMYLLYTPLVGPVCWEDASSTKSYA